MASAVKVLLGVGLVLVFISPLLQAERFGSRAKTLHLHSSKRKDDLGDGFVRIRRSEDMKFQEEENHDRARRSPDDSSRFGDVHDKAKVTKVSNFSFYDLNIVLILKSLFVLIFNIFKPDFYSAAIVFVLLCLFWVKINMTYFILRNNKTVNLRMIYNGMVPGRTLSCFICLLLFISFLI